MVWILVIKLSSWLCSLDAGVKSWLRLINALHANYFIVNKMGDFKKYYLNNLIEGFLVLGNTRFDTRKCMFSINKIEEHMWYKRP